MSKDGTTASLAWGMVDPALQGQGFGTALLRARLDAAARIPSIRRVILDTSQHTHGFYARFGFVILTVTPDGYGDRLDRLDMELLISPQAPNRSQNFHDGIAD